MPKARGSVQQRPVTNTDVDLAEEPVARVIDEDDKSLEGEAAVIEEEEAAVEELDSEELNPFGDRWEE